MDASDPRKALHPPALSADAPRREPLLDPFVCGIREIEDPPAATGRRPDGPVALPPPPRPGGPREA